jgi:hypothetical protein
VGKPLKKTSENRGLFLVEESIFALNKGQKSLEESRRQELKLWHFLTGLTGFSLLRKIDITNKEVPKSAFFVSLKGFLAGTWFLQKYNFLSTIFLV